MFLFIIAYIEAGKSDVREANTTVVKNDFFHLLGLGNHQEPLGPGLHFRHQVAAEHLAQVADTSNRHVWRWRRRYTEAGLVVEPGESLSVAPEARLLEDDREAGTVVYDTVNTFLRTYANSIPAYFKEDPLDDLASFADLGLAPLIVEALSFERQERRCQLKAVVQRSGRISVEEIPAFLPHIEIYLKEAERPHYWTAFDLGKWFDLVMSDRDLSSAGWDSRVKMTKKGNKMPTYLAGVRLVCAFLKHVFPGATLPPVPFSPDVGTPGDCTTFLRTINRHVAARFPAGSPAAAP
ncbi:hypothetical protein B9479_007053 [Cryptococcus floricola]|uniref:Uncharacterized protein n=1 Tax=Cryptococcus floricola TaxID=2591691 RepID=A0A5D3APX1_9TREE|nr:hypothetical protein B9479_007053 [Cryptococcus floricola]